MHSAHEEAQGQSFQHSQTSRSDFLAPASPQCGSEPGFLVQSAWRGLQCNDWKLVRSPRRSGGFAQCYIAAGNPKKEVKGRERT
jgi:hypothetical protein